MLYGSDTFGSDAIYKVTRRILRRHTSSPVQSAGKGVKYRRRGINKTRQNIMFLCL